MLLHVTTSAEVHLFPAETIGQPRVAPSLLKKTKSLRRGNTINRYL